MPVAGLIGVSQASSVASIGARSSAPGFTSHRAGFAAVLGDRPRLAPVLACDAHEGPVYFPEEDALYFTTLPRRERGMPHVAIRRIQLDGERFPLEPDRLSVVVAEGFDKPNGLAFSPDERVLYVGDSGANQEPGSYYPERPHDITAFDVGAGGLTGRRQFARTTPGFPDGIKVDSEGRVYASSSSGVQVFAPGGGLLGEIRLPGAVNFTFGGPGRNVLFITADDAVWAAVLEAKGA